MNRASGFQFTDHRLQAINLLAASWLMVAICGCGEPGNSAGPLSGSATVGDQRGQFFQTFASNLNQLEDFPPERMLPLLRDHLNHWRRESNPEVSWQLDPVIGSLPKPLQELPEVKRVNAPDYDQQDMQFLMECVWLRDIAKTASEGVDDLVNASRLFDWTIRNLQIEPEGADNGVAANQSLGEILLLGRGTVLERAWVFIQLCRQQGLEAVMLAIPGEKDTTKLRPWLPAVQIRDELYLFDPRLGLPIPGPEGKPVATLSQVAEDDALLRALDLDAEHAYPVKSSDLQGVVALVEASPGYLSRGMKLVESRLAGDERVVLTTDPSKSIEAIKRLPHISDARLWLMPYEVLQARRNWSEPQRQAAARDMRIFLRGTPLYDARVRQFKGNLDGEQGAKGRYLEARPPQSQVDAIPVPAEQKQVFQEVKQAASYWLGLIAFDEQQYPAAVHWLYDLVLISSPGGPWTSGARYNLGRTYEAMGEIEKAVAQYQLDKSPQSVGNRLRARRMMAKSKNPG